MQFKKELLDLYQQEIDILDKMAERQLRIKGDVDEDILLEKEVFTWVIKKTRELLTKYEKDESV